MTAILPIPPAATVEADASSFRDAPCLRIDLGSVRSNYLEMRRRYRGQIVSAVVKSD